MILFEQKTLIWKQRTDPAAFHQSTCVSAKCLWVKKLWLNRARGTSADITAVPPPFMSHSGLSFVLIFTFWLSVHAFIWVMFCPYSFKFWMHRKEALFSIGQFFKWCFSFTERQRKNKHKKKTLEKSRSRKSFSKCMTFSFYIWSVALGS